MRIEPKALEVLIYLVERRDRVVTKQELLDDVWRGTVVTENALTRAVAQIRKVLGDDLQSPRYIQTVPTKGYRFIASHSDAQRGEAADLGAGFSGPTGGGRVGGPRVDPAPIAVPEPDSPRPFRLGLTLVVVTMAAIAAVLVSLFAAFIQRQLKKPRFIEEGQSAPTAITARPLRAAPHVQSFPSFSPDASMVAYAVDVDGTSHIFVSRVDGSEEKQITTGDGETQPSWSPDGRTIAFVSLRHSGIWLVRADGGDPAQLTKSGTRPQWSPDGREIAFQTGENIEYGWTSFDALPASTISIVNVESARVTPLTAPGQPAGGHGAPSWRPDGNRLTFSSCEIERCAIFTIGRDGSGLSQVVTDARRLFSPVFSRDGDSLLYVLARYNDSLLLSVRINSQGQRDGDNPVRLRQSGPGVIQHVAISRDGSRIAWSLVEESSDLYAKAIGSDAPPLQLTRNPTLRSTYPAFSPDGSRIAYSVVAAGVDSGIWIVNADGSNARAVATGARLKQHTGWLRDGFSIVYYAWADGPTVFQVSLVTGNVGAIAHLPRDASAPAISPDNSTVAFNRTINGVVSVWSDLRAGSEPQRISGPSVLARLPVWSPDGESLAVQLRSDSGSAVAVIPSTGGAARTITTQAGESHPYGWSPDGKFISFAGRRNGVWNIYSVPSSGGAERRLTDNKSTTTWLRSPSWSPKGDRIVYEQGAPKSNIWVSVNR